jgi:hypothetical protein
MSLKLAIIFNFFSLVSLGQIQEVKLNDKGIEAALNAYVNLIDANSEKPKVNYHLQVRIENYGSSKIVYVSSVVFISSFKFGVPDKYSKLGTHLVFLYEMKNKSTNDDSFREFQNQFGKELINNLKSDGSFDSGFNPEHIDYYAFEGEGDIYRFVVTGSKVRSSRRICRFPNAEFYQKGYLYDKNGDLMYEDGAYDICSLDQSSRFYRDDFDPVDYIWNNSGISNEVIGNHAVGMSITIDKKGKPIKAEVHDKDGVLTEQQKLKLVDVVLNMPNWNPQTVNKKKVCYRILVML